MRKRSALVLSAGIALLAAAGLLACNSSDGSAKANSADPPAASVAKVQRGSISHVLSLAGQFQPYQVVDVHAKVSGYIRHIYVDIGDKVHAGETLAVLEVPELDAQLKGSVSELARSKDEITRAQHEVARAESEHAAVHAHYTRLKQTSDAQPGLVAQQELDDAQSKDLSAEAQVDAAKAALSAARQGSDVANADRERVQALNDYTHVTAPLDGVITWRYADTGALIQAGTNSNEQSLPIVKLAQSGLLRLRMPIPEDDVQSVHVGDQIEIRIDALNRSITGKIVRFTRSLNFETRTMETEVDVENKDLSIDPGMYANTTLQLATAQSVLTIPVEALVLKGNKQTVYTLDENNRIHMRDVDVGLQGSKLAEIKSGLRQGERVIIGGQEKYSEGEQVSPILVPPPASDVKRESGSVIDIRSEEGEGGSQ